MESKIRWVWWGILAVLVAGAAWKMLLPHGTTAQVRQSAAPREIVVYVAGAVTTPGLVHLPLDARLDDALRKAIPAANADLDALNPAEKLRDGQKINVPAKQQAVAPGGSVAANSPASPTPAGSASAKGKININTAGAAELDQLPGVGPVLAQRIVDYRTEHGPFAAPEDLQNVAGIGAKTYEKMAAMVTVGP